jgi:hypothetical protein
MDSKDKVQYMDFHDFRKMHQTINFLNIEIIGKVYKHSEYWPYQKVVIAKVNIEAKSDCNVPDDQYCMSAGENAARFCGVVEQYLENNKWVSPKPSKCGKLNAIPLKKLLAGELSSLQFIIFTESDPKDNDCSDENIEPSKFLIGGLECITDKETYKRVCADLTLPIND